MHFIKKYQHGLWITGFSILYSLCFFYLERRSVASYHLIHSVLDDKIPFCEYFIVPYLLWFPYMFLTVLYFIFWNQEKQECYQLTKNLIMGMSLFLVISFLYPNMQNLRPLTFERQNIFTELVLLLYQNDTPTNILPSIHVFNSLAIHIAIWNCKALSKHRRIGIASFFLTFCIILSTMFLKQHSIIDVCMGTGLALLGYVFFYGETAPAKKSALVAKHHC